MTTTQVLDETTAAILSAYVDGDDATEIATSLRLPRSKVTTTLFQVCSYDRDKARRLLAGEPAEPTPALDVAPPVPTPANEPLEAVPADTTGAWGSVPVEPTIRVGTWAQLLDDAEATGEPRLVRKVQQVRGLIQEIHHRLEAIREDQTARAEVARLEAELAAARARLRGRTAQPTSPAPTAQPEERAPAASTSEIRAWALDRGFEVSPKGVLPAVVLKAWDEHHRSAA